MIISVRKVTAQRIKRLKISDNETYDSIINRIVKEHNDNKKVP